MAQVDILKPMIETNLICIRCVPPHIKGLCRCEEPHYIPIQDFLHLDSYGQRDYLNKIVKQ